MLKVEPFIVPSWILEAFLGLTPAEIAKVLPHPADENDSSQSVD